MCNQVQEAWRLVTPPSPWKDALPVLVIDMGPVIVPSAVLMAPEIGPSILAAAAIFVLFILFAMLLTVISIPTTAIILILLTQCLYWPGLLWP